MLRRAKDSDASSLAAISIEVWLGTYLREGVSEFFADYALETFTPESFRTILKDSSETLWVSENKVGIDGFIRITEGSVAPVAGCSTTEISTFYVQPRHHGQGIGLELLAKARPLRPWLATNAQNTPAIGFYLAQGFVHKGETHFRIDGEAYLNNVYGYQGG